MIVNYFEKIDTKDKAYWLGFLYADGNVSIYKGTKRLEFAISSKDETVIDKFINAIQTKTEKDQKNDLSRIRFASNKLCSDLISHGCVPRKSKIIELPKLDSRELYLAFLLGFFDGDGSQGKTVITCGSLKFLEQVKEMFHLSFKIRYEEHDGYIDGNRKIHSAGYFMYLGAALFNEMMENYQNSLYRKRKHFECTTYERSERRRERLERKP